MIFLTGRKHLFAVIKMKMNTKETKMIILNCKQNNHQNKEIKCKDKTLDRITMYEYLKNVLT